jgi:hypothetical protein
MWKEEVAPLIWGTTLAFTWMEPWSGNVALLRYEPVVQNAAGREWTKLQKACLRKERYSCGTGQTTLQETSMDDDMMWWGISCSGFLSFGFCSPCPMCNFSSWNYPCHKLMLQCTIWPYPESWSYTSSSAILLENQQYQSCNKFSSQDVLLILHNNTIFHLPVILMFGPVQFTSLLMRC